MENTLKNILKMTVACTLITGGFIVAGTVFAAKKIDESGDDLEDKIPENIKAYINKMNKETMQKNKGKLQESFGTAKEVAQNTKDKISDKVDDIKKNFNKND